MKSKEKGRECTRKKRETQNKLQSRRVSYSSKATKEGTQEKEPREAAFEPPSSRSFQLFPLKSESGREGRETSAQPSFFVSTKIGEQKENVWDFC